MQRKPLVEKLKYLRTSLEQESDPLIKLDLTQKIIDTKKKLRVFSVYRKG